MTLSKDPHTFPEYYGWWNMVVDSRVADILIYTNPKSGVMFFFKKKKKKFRLLLIKDALNGPKKIKNFYSKEILFFWTLYSLKRSERKKTIAVST